MALIVRRSRHERTFKTLPVQCLVNLYQKRNTSMNSFVITHVPDAAVAVSLLGAVPVCPVDKTTYILWINYTECTK
jgi:hypothetical protein